MDAGDDGKDQPTRFDRVYYYLYHGDWRGEPWVDHYHSHPRYYVVVEDDVDFDGFGRNFWVVRSDFDSRNLHCHVVVPIDVNDSSIWPPDSWVILGHHCPDWWWRWYYQSLLPSVILRPWW